MRHSLASWRIAPYVLFLVAALALLFISVAEARNVRGGTAQSVHGGGHRGGASASHRSGGGERAAANRNAGGGRDVNRNTNTNRNRDVERNRNVERNVDRDVNIHNDIDIDVDNGWDGHPVARGVAFGTAAAVTAAAIGSVVYSVPPACAMRPYGAMTYYYCDNIWYEPRYSGSSVTYVVVEQPY